MKSLKVPPPSIPTSSSPCSLINETRIYIHQEVWSIIWYQHFSRMCHVLNPRGKIRECHHTGPLRSSESKLSWSKASSKSRLLILNRCLVNAECDVDCLEHVNWDCSQKVKKSSRHCFRRCINLIWEYLSSQKFNDCKLVNIHTCFSKK
jgi:hypothetical protein